MLKKANWLGFFFLNEICGCHNVVALSISACHEKLLHLQSILTDVTKHAWKCDPQAAGVGWPNLGKMLQYDQNWHLWNDPVKRSNTSLGPKVREQQRQVWDCVASGVKTCGGLKLLILMAQRKERELHSHSWTAWVRPTQTWVTLETQSRESQRLSVPQMRQVSRSNLITDGHEH